MRIKSYLFKLLFIHLVALMVSPLLSAQTEPDLTVDLTVIDSTGEPLPGATVQIVGKAQGVMTDANGKALLYVKKGTTIEVRYVGMKSERKKILAPFKGTIQLEDDAATLDQVVVTGYKKTTKRRTTGSVATIDVSELKGKPIENLDAQLRGKVAGLEIKNQSGRPGESAKVRVRGVNSITGNTEPLWVIDGVPLQRDIPKISSNQIQAGDFNDIFANGISGINPNDIASITVLKDASAAAIYGSRAAGGVIVVTTKQGEAGRMRVNYSTNFSVVTSPPRDANLMNSREKLEWEQRLWDHFSQDNYEHNRRYPVIGVVGMIRSGYDKYAGWTLEQQNAEIERLAQHSTDWFQELFHNSLSQSHNLSLSGGSNSIKYYVSGGVAINNGLVKNTSYDRYNITSKLDFTPNTRLRFGLKTDLALQESKSPSISVDPYKYAYFANPYERPYDEQGGYAADHTYHSLIHANKGVATVMPEEGFNILREMEETSNKVRNISALVAATANVTLLDHLSFDGMASFGYVSDASDNINGENSFAAWIDRPFERSLTSRRKYGSIFQTAAFNTSYNLRGQFNYYNTFADDHYVSALLGSEIRGQFAKSIYAKRYGYDPVSGNSSMPVYDQEEGISQKDLISYASIIDGLSGQSIIESAFASFYFSADYVYQQKYILSLTARTDGSNSFGSKEQFNPTGSLGLAWHVDQERFMEAVKPILSSMTIRSSIGYTGNVNRSIFPQLVMEYRRDFRKVKDGFERQGVIWNAPNPHLRWEKTRDMKLSLDLGFFSDRLRIQGEIYDRHTYDAVSSVPIPYATGFSQQSLNTSELLNRGAELTVSATVINTDDWRLNLSTNVAYNDNRLLKFDSPNPTTFGAYNVGYPLGAIISGKVQGIDKKFGVYTYEPRPDTKFRSPADRNQADNYAFYLGTSNAPVNGGYSIYLSYKNLGVGLGGTYSVGALVENNIISPAKYNLLSDTKQERIATQENDLYAHFLNVTKDATYRWTPDNPITDGKPRLIDAYGQPLGIQDYVITDDLITRASMLQDLSYFKLGTMYMNYSIPERLIQRIGMSSMTLSFSANNLLILSAYKGLDPETPGAVYPSPRTYSLGMSIGF